MTDIIPVERIEQTILLVRGQKVIMDVDLAILYGVSTKRLNEQVKRNLERFPHDFMFQLNSREMDELVAKCDRFKNLKHSTVLAHVFTEHGALMLANLLKSPIAVQASIHVVRTFIKLREILATHKDLARKLAQLEKTYNHQFKMVFEAIRQLMETPTPKPKNPIGFRK
ncbi:MAG: ORF6N domain-containing protein [Deltaproteobacteria bacterium]|nr:ORF6N domain-containing protein [Deltaproteobacteria bacterium]